KHDQDPADRSVAGEEQLDLELPSRAVSFVNVPGPRRMCRDPFAASHPEAFAPRQALKRDMLVLAFPHRRGLQGLPQRLLPVPPVAEVGEYAQPEPRHEDEGDDRDVWRLELWMQPRKAVGKEVDAGHRVAEP